VPYSNALQSRIRGRGHYLVGPGARYSLNFDRLAPLAQEAARTAGLGAVCRNPYQSIVVRSVEVLYACDEALRVIDAYDEPERPSVAVEPRAGTGYGCTEAPRGSLSIRRWARSTPKRSQSHRAAAICRYPSASAPDLATCSRCLGELRDPRDRRFAYALTNCTDCEPRLSILGSAPWRGCSRR
jgi:hypothetical protein